MTSIPRRRFLASTPVVAAPLIGMDSAVARPTAPSGALQGPAWRLLAVAPQSRKISDLESHYRAGVAWGLSRTEGVSTQLHWIGADPLPGKAARTIETALNELPEFDGVVGWMPPELERRVAPMTHARGLPLWVSDTGADMRPDAAAMPLRAHGHNSLALCEQAQRLAKVVMQRQGPRAVLAVGWMESGYDFVTTFHHAYRALGGQIVGRHLGGPREQAKEFEGLRRTIFEHRPDAVVAFYSGPQALRFAQWWQSHAHAQGRWTLATLPWMTELAGANIAVNVPPDTAEPQWRALFRQANMPWSAASLLGAEAGHRIGASLKGLPKGASSAAIGLAWMQAPSAGLSSGPSLNGSPVVRAAIPQQATSGWLNGYLQT